MTHSVRAAQLAALRRARLLGRLGPVAALAAAGSMYALHHTSLDGHGLWVALLIVAAAAFVAVFPAALARSAERQLPVVVTVRPGSAEIREVRMDDLDFCAALHAQTLPHGFFAQLGHRFLRAYLATFVASPHAVALLVTAHDVPVGMVVGVLRPNAHGRWVVRRHGVRLALLGGMALACRPRLALRFFRTRVAKYRSVWARRRMPPLNEARAQPAVLSHIAVAPGAQRARLGGQLVEAFVEAARAAASTRVVLTTLADENGAAGFYRRHGWVEETPRRGLDGQSMIGFSLVLDAGEIE